MCAIICGKMYFAGGTFISENSREAFKSDDATFKCMYVKAFFFLEVAQNGIDKVQVLNSWLIN
jgi:hypothetical protein